MDLKIHLLKELRTTYEEVSYTRKSFIVFSYFPLRKGDFWTDFSTKKLSIKIGMGRRPVDLSVKLQIYHFVKLHLFQFEDDHPHMILWL